VPVRSWRPPVPAVQCSTCGIAATEYSVATFAAEHACPWGGLDGFEILEAPPELQRQDFRPMAHEYVPGRQPASARGNETPRVPTSSRCGGRDTWWGEAGGAEAPP